MSKSKRKQKSKQWGQRQDQDFYVQQARLNGYRGRAVYKLKQINERFRLISPKDNIVELGAAPGSWSQLLSSMVSEQGKLISVDILPMEPVERVQFIQGDFTSPEVLADVVRALEGEMADLVLSDMAPNITGVRSVDQARARELQEIILWFCDQALRGGGCLLTKLFEGELVGEIRKILARKFATVQTIKPAASRARSKEIFLMAKDYQRSSLRD